MQADICVWPVWGMNPRWAGWLMSLVAGEPRDQHVALSFEDGTLLHMGEHGGSSRLVKYDSYVELFHFPSRRVGEFDLDPYAIAGAVGQRRSTLMDEIIYTLFSKEKGRWWKILPMRRPTNCVTVAVGVLINSGYDIDPDIYYPRELLEATR